MDSIFLAFVHGFQFQLFVNFFFFSFLSLEFAYEPINCRPCGNTKQEHNPDSEKLLHFLRDHFADSKIGNWQQLKFTNFNGYIYFRIVPINTSDLIKRKKTNHGKKLIAGSLANH